MKVFTIKNVKRFDRNMDIDGLVCEGKENMEASDGDHTFSELYEHRCVLFIRLCFILSCIGIDWGKKRPDPVYIWRSKLHADGKGYKGWFVMGIGKLKGKQISYHLPMSKWKETKFADTLKKAPEWDGHTASDVLERIKKL